MAAEGRLEIDVEWGDCDPARIVFYPNYLRWFDAAFHHWLIDAGKSHEQLAAEHGALGTPLLGVEARFLAPSAVGDRLLVVSRVERWERRRFVVRHRIFNRERLAVDGTETRCWAVLDEAGALRALPIPEELRRLLE